MKTENELNQLCATFKESYGSETNLYDVKDVEFETGGIVSEIVRACGYEEAGKKLCNDRNCWRMTVAAFCEQMVLEAETGDGL